MKKFILNPIYTEPIFNLEREEIETLFRLYGSVRDNISEESLGKMTANIAISFGDFIVRVGSNIKANVGGVFKEFKRSVLLIELQSNKFAVNRLYSANYSEVNLMQIPSYPFNKPPKDVANFLIKHLSIMDMERRIDTLIDKYSMIAANIVTNNIDVVESLIHDINTINLSEYNAVVKELAKLIANNKPSTFGNTFNSVSEFKDTIDLVATQCPELERAMKVGSKLDKLYSAFQKIQSSIIRVKDNNIDLHRISAISAIMNDTGMLIEQYAVFVKEYHHLEMWMVNVIRDGIAFMKK